MKRRLLIAVVPAVLLVGCSDGDALLEAAEADPVGATKATTTTVAVGPPQACVDALDAADALIAVMNDGLDIASDAIGAAGDGFEAAADFDVAGIEAAGARIEQAGDDAESLTPEARRAVDAYDEAKADCLGA